jgi:hypothetical protein
MVLLVDGVVDQVGHRWRGRMAAANEPTGSRCDALKSPNRDEPIMYCITLSEQVGHNNHRWYDGSASNFSTDQRRAKLFSDRVDADLVAYQLRRMYPRISQNIEVTPAAQPTAMIYNFDHHNGVVVV